MKTAYDIIIRPVITEQSMADTEMKRYTFEVAKSANKIEIAKAVEQIFGVKVAKVNTLNTYDILNCDTFIIAQDAVSKLEEVYA